MSKRSSVGVLKAQVLRGGAALAPQFLVRMAGAAAPCSIFVVLLVVTDLAREYWGRVGLYSLAAIMGVTDVEPFILGLAQSSTVTPVQLAARAIVIAAASSSIVKAIYAYWA